MYVDISSRRVGDKAYTRALLRESYREDGKVKHRTIANISSCSQQEIAAIQLALRNKHALTEVGTIRDSVKVEQGRAAGALIVLMGLAQELGLVDALGPGREAALALWQVIARVIDQGSRLSATRLANVHAVPELMGMRFDEDDLYANLDWLCEQQSRIEKALFRRESVADGLFLYDVTSSYLEGEENALATFGYNRDGKKGKQQIVVGLLCNSQGVPLSIEVFEGNTQDPGTVLSQVRKVADRFGGGEVTFVGDRGMIKGPQIEALGEAGFHYITAITKPTIERLLAEGRFQMNLFDNVLAEVEAEGVRYVLRRNPVRQAEMAASRQEREGRLRQALQERNAYLVAHPRARVEVALAALKALTGRLKLSGWMAVTANERVLVLTEDATVRAEDARLDGCYTLKTDLPRSCVTKEVIHERYKDLAKVEQAFRTSKTAHLELRPVYVRRESRTRGHALVVMLAYRLVQELRQRWSSLDCTVEEGIAQLSTLTLITITVQGVEPVVQIPKPTADVQALLDLAHIRLPAKIPSATGKVSTKNRLPNDRKLH